MKENPTLYVGQTILIVLINNKERNEFFSKIKNIDSKSIILDNPFEEKKLTIKKEDLLSFFVLENNDVFTFASKIEEIKFGHIPEIRIEKPKETIHNHRRITIRFPLNVIVKYEFFLPKSFFGSIKVPKGQAYAKNICIGGILLETEDKLPNKSKEIKLHFTLPSYPTLNIDGKISRIKQQDKKTEFVVTFDNLNPEDKENIIRYIFNSQKNNMLEKTLLEKI